MNRPSQIIAGIMATTGIVGLVMTSLPLPSGAETVAPKNTYDPELISRYNSGCVKKLMGKGKTEEQAKQLCQCSMNNMQNKKTQSEAISLLIQSQFSFSKDPETGMPRSLAEYFDGCSA
ncbi:MAG: hypothetical protein HC934_09065 [Acaryochloridaceae cyanobacterium SU_2_1]|nr:hypothetical protein [Acaryochloridaceae cyanobacterium SU_2_1]